MIRVDQFYQISIRFGSVATSSRNMLCYNTTYAQYFGNSDIPVVPWCIHVYHPYIGYTNVHANVMMIWGLFCFISFRTTEVVSFQKKKETFLCFLVVISFFLLSLKFQEIYFQNFYEIIIKISRVGLTISIPKKSPRDIFFTRDSNSLFFS